MLRSPRRITTCFRLLLIYLWSSEASPMCTSSSSSSVGSHAASLLQRQVRRSRLHHRHRTRHSMLVKRDLNISGIEASGNTTGDPQVALVGEPHSNSVIDMALGALVALVGDANRSLNLETSASKSSERATVAVPALGFLLLSFWLSIIVCCVCMAPRYLGTSEEESHSTSEGTAPAAAASAAADPKQ